MQYKLTTLENYSCFASGKVIRSLPGNPAFPVRLMSEIFQYCLLNSQKQTFDTIYDPCCGSAYHLTVLAFLHFKNIRNIYCSDIDSTILDIARSNLAILSISGIQERLTELESIFQKFKKTSHSEAIECAKKFTSFLRANASHQIATRVFKHNVLDTTFPSELCKKPLDLVFADVPYGVSSNWLGNTSLDGCVKQLLNNIYPFVDNHSFIVISQIDKAPLLHENYSQIKKMKHGKRVIRILKTSK